MKPKYSYDELLEMEKTTIPLTKRKLDGIVFGYADLNAGDQSRLSAFPIFTLTAMTERKYPYD